MLRIRTGARAGFVGRCSALLRLLPLLTLSSSSSRCRALRERSWSMPIPATCCIRPIRDARRHPASLTKIMTLYMLFEQLEAGKLKLDSELKVSEHAASQSPTKLGLRAGSTIQVEDAIKGIVTRSANDASVVVAEAIAGDEDDFAELMTRKAQALGMTRTVYKNASGLPDDDQVTTARDQSILGRASRNASRAITNISRPAPSRFRGQWISNHNRLLGRVEGVDGIKTGYIRASGFNLVTSVNRGNRYVVAVVMGGSSAGSRDARMRELLSEHIGKAATKRSAPMVAEAASESKVLKPRPPPRPSRSRSPRSRRRSRKLQRAEPKVAAKPEPEPRPSRATRSRAPAACRCGWRRRKPSRRPSSGRAAGRHRLDRADPAGPGEDVHGAGRYAIRVARPACTSLPRRYRAAAARRPSRLPRPQRSKPRRRPRRRLPPPVARPAVATPAPMRRPLKLRPLPTARCRAGSGSRLPPRASARACIRTDGAGPGRSRRRAAAGASRSAHSRASKKPSSG